MRKIPKEHKHSISHCVNRKQKHNVYNVPNLEKLVFANLYFAEENFANNVLMWRIIQKYTYAMGHAVRYCSYDAYPVFLHKESTQIISKLFKKLAHNPIPTCLKYKYTRRLVVR